MTGLVGLIPVGGVAWDYLQYVIGLARLGHDVYYYEDTWSWPYQPVQLTNTNDPSYSIRFLAEFFDRFAPDLRSHWRYVHLHESAYGISDASWREVVRTADLFINVSGASMIPDDLAASCLKVFVDTDPGYNQIVIAERPAWSENVDRWIALVDAHDRHLTYAENIDGADCRVPIGEYRWTTTRMPIVLDLWRLAKPPWNAAWTTVMTWNAFKGPLVHEGIEYHSKGAEFEKLMSLPRKSPVELEVAIGGVGAPIEKLAAGGWSVVDAPKVTRTAEAYRSYIARSAGEVSIAKQVYVALRTGWFSCRSACYLASGRPVIVQDTGFRHILPVGAGLLAFDDEEEVLTHLTAVAGDYGRHAAAAQEVAEAAFDSRSVLQDLLSNAYSRSHLTANSAEVARAS